MVFSAVRMKTLSTGPGLTLLTRMRRARDLFGDATHQTHQSVFGRDVGAIVGDALHPDDARGDDDAATVIHLRDGVFAGQESSRARGWR